MDGLKKMNTGILVINVVILLAVAVLYFFQFSGDNDEGGHGPELKPADVSKSDQGTPSSIAFVNSDLLLEKYGHLQ